MVDFIAQLMHWPSWPSNPTTKTDRPNRWSKCHWLFIADITLASGHPFSFHPTYRLHATRARFGPKNTSTDKHIKWIYISLRAQHTNSRSKSVNWFSTEWKCRPPRTRQWRPSPSQSSPNQIKLLVPHPRFFFFNSSRLSRRNAHAL